jgi:starch-binding outer membrane protein, SusD/RagB family
MNKILILLATLFFVSCSSELDSIKPKDQIPQDELSNADISSLRVGMYSQMENVMWAYWFDFDRRAVQYMGGPGFPLTSDPVNMTPSDADLANMWQTSYIALAKINFLLQVIDDNASSASFASIKGEALYFRALIYYQLVVRWGGVPILTQRSSAAVQRNTEAEVWTQIKTDLTTAETLVPAFSDRFYISDLAVQALLARVYLATNDKTNAIVYCDKVLNAGKMTLAPDANGYASMFIAGSTSKELIFALANNTSTNPHLFYQQLNDVDGSWSYSPATTIYSSLYIATDKRKSAVFSSDPSRVIKFPNGVAGQQLVATTNANFTPIVISRIAEIYLIKAEAQGPGADAGATLAPYFTARYTAPPTADDIAALDATAFMDLILEERHREFYGEGYRWYDIKRTNRLDLLPSLNGRNYLLYYPIPQTEVDLAGYKQNPSY